MPLTTPKEGPLTITPENIFHMDSEAMNAKEYAPLIGYLNQVMQTKNDLITILHFSKLHSSMLNIYFQKANISVEGLDTKEGFQKFKQRAAYEKKEGGELIDATNESKANIKVDFNKYMFSEFGDRGAKHYNPEKEIPMTVESQKTYLDELIRQGFFNVIDDYNKRTDLLEKMLHSMACTVGDAVHYKISYIKYIIVEAFKLNKLSDICLGKLIKIWFSNTFNKDSDRYSILTFLHNINKYPELVDSIFEIMKVVIKNPEDIVIGSDEYFPEDNEKTDENDTRNRIKKRQL